MIQATAIDITERNMAEQVLHRRGVDPDAAEYQAARRHARSVLDAADSLHRDRTA